MENLCLSRRESNNAILCVCATACLPAYVADNDSNVVELAHVGSLYCASLKMTMKDDDLLSRCNYYKQMKIVRHKTYTQNTSCGNCLYFISRETTKNISGRDDENCQMEN